MLRDEIGKEVELEKTEELKSLLMMAPNPTDESEVITGVLIKNEEMIEKIENEELFEKIQEGEETTEGIQAVIEGSIQDSSGTGIKDRL